METSNRSTRFGARLVALALVIVLLAAAIPASAVDVADVAVPADAAVGSKIDSTVRLTDLYRDPALESWTLAGQTQLTDVTWTVTFYDQGGNQLRQESHDGQTLQQEGIDLASGVSEVGVSVTGRVPPVTDYQYDPAQSFEVMSLAVTRPGGSSAAIGSWRVHHFTAESQTAATAIDEAVLAIDAAQAAGSRATEAESSLAFAIEAYEGENFALATTLAEQASAEAAAAEQAAESNRLLLYAGAAVVALAVLGAVLFWLRSRREGPYDRLG